MKQVMLYFFFLFIIHSFVIFFKQSALSAIEAKLSYVDVDPAFCAANDEDFDINQLVSFSLYTKLTIIAFLRKDDF